MAHTVGQYLVHYEGWGCQLDEWVSKERCRKPMDGPLVFGPQGPEDDEWWLKLRSDLAEYIKQAHTSVIYDSSMLNHECKCRKSDAHPENPMRLERILDMIDTSDLLDRCLRPVAREASEEELKLVHSDHHVTDFG
jgi:hypothetical protein